MNSKNVFWRAYWNQNIFQRRKYVEAYTEVLDINVFEWRRKWSWKQEKTVNKYATLNIGKCLTLGEKQKLIIAKQQIETERLKKEYVVKGAYANKEFVTLNEMNMK